MPLHKIIECLGLVPLSNPDKPIRFENEYCVLLSKEVCRLSKEVLNVLPKRSNASRPELRESLLKFAMDPCFLEKSLETLLERYGPLIWRTNGDRNHLLEPDPDKEYKKNLFYDIESDRKA